MNKWFIILVFPALCYIWLIGWLLIIEDKIDEDKWLKNISKK